MTQSPDPVNFNSIIDGKQTGLWFLRNKNGSELAITNYGARIVNFVVPDKKGNLVDVVSGFDNITDYEKSLEPYYGAIIGRFGNRIANGTFSLDGQVFNLFQNDGSNTLHGGRKGFQYVVWQVGKITVSSLEMTYLAEDMEEGFPGNLNVKVVYSLSDWNELKISYEATTDRKTVINPSNHAFFNLNGAGNGTINRHTLQISADFYTPINSSFIPNGEIADVEGTPLDFRKPMQIGARLHSNHEQLVNGKGYDHNYLLRSSRNYMHDPVARVTGDQTGIVMEVITSEPGMQLYGGNFMQGINIMRGGQADHFRTAFCLETQHFPDSPNQPGFPSTVLEVGKVFRSWTTYRFSSISEPL